MLDLELHKTRLGPLLAGGVGTYLLTVRNIGTLDALPSDVMVTDPLPVGLTLASTSGTNWDCSASTLIKAQCTLTVGLAAGVTAPALTLTVNIASDAPFIITNIAGVTSTGRIDVNHLNNMDEDRTQLGPGPGRSNPVPVPTVSVVGDVLAVMAMLCVAWASRHRF